MLVVISIILLLIGILLPALSKARANGRNTVCTNNLRQWGIAAQAYCDDNKDFLPKPQFETGSSAKDDQDDGKWYNALPPYINAPKYSLIYDGSKTKEYKQEHIWWCPEARLQFVEYGFTSAGNAFDYAFNTVLDGTSSYGPKPPSGQRHINTYHIKETSKTLIMTEPVSRVEYVSIGSASTGVVDPDRHFGQYVNMLFLDSHVTNVVGKDAQTVYSGPGRPINTTYWTTNEGEVVWGSFYRGG
ncbi:MAG: DUF1559 domain-containing protein [Phycisphaeraceae bacterium]|nr:DUF1559 domain-containing protein [Phycisphaeraceae bacterium]